MPLVFISHAHSDEALASGLRALLCDALGLAPSEIFVSSEEGRGVAPGSNIQDSVLEVLSNVPTLIVLLTPKSALSRWVWLESGIFLGRPDKANPLFVCPSARHTSLLGPIGGHKALNLDNENELVELVNEVSARLQRPARDFLSYKPALSQLVSSSARDYSVARERRATALSWVGRHWQVLTVTPLLLWLANSNLDLREDLASERAEVTRLNDAWNANNEAIVSQYFVLTGIVQSARDGKPIAVADALVMVSQQDQVVKESAGCIEPKCISFTTGDDGKFSLDLTRIQARKEQRINLIVLKTGFAPSRSLIKIDVRAMDAGVESQNVMLAAAGPANVIMGSPQ